jgi:hypothetical protein
MIKYIFSLILFAFSCAFPHNITFGDIDNTSSKRKPFKVLISERGYDFAQGIEIAQAGLLAANTKANMDSVRELQYVKLIIDLSTMGPVTGRKSFNGDYANGLTDIIFQHCKSGKIVNLKNIRESAIYPVVSGEIIRIEGECLE